MSVSDLNGTYVIDPTHSSLSFVTRHAMVTKVRGSFDKFEGQATVNGANPAESSLEVVIDASSITTRNEDRDAHLRSADFFNVEQNPTWKFVATDFAINGDIVEVTGDLGIAGTTRSVTFPLEFQGSAKDPFGNIRVGFEGSTEILRSDFGLTWNAALETGGFLVSDKVAIELEISAIEQAA